MNMNIINYTTYDSNTMTLKNSKVTYCVIDGIAVNDNETTWNQIVRKLLIDYRGVYDPNNYTIINMTREEYMLVRNPQTITLLYDNDYFSSVSSAQALKLIIQLKEECNFDMILCIRVIST